MTIQTVNAEILAGNFTNDQLTSIIDAVKFARARLGESNKRALRIGDRVSFDSTRSGRNVSGTVQKIAIKYVTVNTAQGLWKVPANMLSPVMDAEFA
jgi:acyl-homoserine lactone acylase PvdQ